ncbi:MAG TPA: rhodanese-like domain-containing protein [Sphingobacteriaceae bacterium]
MKNIKKLLQTILVLIFVSAAPAAFSQTIHILVGGKKVDRVIYKKKLQVLDVRTPEEIQEGHLPNAIAYDFKAPGFESKLAALPRDKAYLVYCRSGGRSARTVEMMKNLGFAEVYEMKGGILAYKGKLVKD